MPFESLAAFLDKIAFRYGDTPVAHTADGNQLTYAEWCRRSRSIAAALAGIGVQRGCTVALAFTQTTWLEYLVTYVATLRLGATVASLPSGRTPQELRALASMAAASLIVSAGVSDFGETTASYSSLASRPGTWTGGGEVGPDDCAEVLFTSGSTGNPKPVWCSHADLANTLPYEGVGRDVRLAGFYPIGSNAAQGIVQQMLQPEPYWHGRLEVWNIDIFHPKTFLQLIERHHVNALRLTPTLAALLNEELALHPGLYNVSSISWIKLSSSYSSPKLLSQIKEQFPDAEIINFYGSTEGGRACLRMIYGIDDPASLGRAAPGTEVEIRDADGLPVAPGDIGEIWLRAVGQRSSRAPDTLGKVAADVWVTSGDLGYIDELGSVYLFGRLKDVINVAGTKVSPISIEEAFRSHSGISAVAAFPVPDPVLGEAVGVAVVPTKGDYTVTVTPTELMSFAASRLQPAELPITILLLEELPMTSAGKVDKRTLADMADATEPGSTA